MTSFIRNFLILSMLSTSAYATDTLRFIGDVNFVTGTKFLDTEIGGLSGLTFDRGTNKILAISDDKSQVNESRFYEFRLSLTMNSFAVVPSKVVRLKTQDGTFFKKGAADFEGISLYNGDVLVSSEGAINRQNPIPPQLYQFTRGGAFKAMLPVPEKFLLPKKDQVGPYGSRDNLSFEALSTTLDGKTTFMGSEESLYQDGDMASINAASNTRIIVYKNLKPTLEYAYTLEKVEALKSVDASNAANGLVDIAAIDDNNFFTMERSWLPFINKNVIRIFRCTVTKTTTDVSKMDSLKSGPFTPIEKVLVADLDDFIEQMNPKMLDNIEGITFGPTLPNGHRTLIVVSDNNFGKGQRTLFMAFELITK